MRHHKRDTYHRLRSRSAMSRSISRVSYGWSHSAGVSVPWVGKGLKLHSLARVHFLAESQKMEGSVRADLIFHTCKRGIIQGRLCRYRWNIYGTRYSLTIKIVLKVVPRAFVVIIVEFNFIKSEIGGNVISNLFFR